MVEVSGNDSCVVITVALYGFGLHSGLFLFLFSLCFQLVDLPSIMFITLVRAISELIELWKDVCERKKDLKVRKTRIDIWTIYKVCLDLS